MVESVQNGTLKAQNAAKIKWLDQNIIPCLVQNQH